MGVTWLLGNLAGMNLLWRPGLFPVTLTALGMGGGIVMAVRDRTLRPAAVGLMLLTLVWLSIYFIDINEESLLRLQVPAGWLVSALAAAAATWGLAAIPGRVIQAAVSGVVIAGFALTAAPTAGNVFFYTNSHLEDAFFQAAVTVLPAEPVNVIRLTGEDPPEFAVSPAGRGSAAGPPEAHVKVHRDCPDYLLRPPLRNDTLWSVSRWAAATRDGKTPPGRTFFYLGTRCYAMRDAGGEELWDIDADPELTIHPACRWLLTGYQLTPVAMARLANLSEYAPAFRWYPESPAELTLGLVELGPSVSRDPAQRTFDNLAENYRSQAARHQRESDYDQAESALLEGYEVLPENIHMWRHLAGHYFLVCSVEETREDCERSLEFMERIVARDPDYLHILSHTGSVFFQYLRFLKEEEVEEYLDQRLAATPDDLLGLYLKGVWLFYKHWDYVQSIEYFNRVLARKKTEPRVYGYLALNHFYLGHRELAEELAEKSIASSNEEDADSYYIRSIVVRHKDLPQAMRDIERYLELSQGPGRVKYQRKQEWLKRELKNLKEGKVSPWWRSMTRGGEPWNEDLDETEPEPGGR